LYLLETIPLMDPQAPDYALVLLTLVESILEDPDIILRKQLDKSKSAVQRKEEENRRLRKLVRSLQMKPAR